MNIPHIKYYKTTATTLLHTLVPAAPASELSNLYGFIYVLRLAKAMAQACLSKGVCVLIHISSMLHVPNNLQSNFNCAGARVTWYLLQSTYKALAPLLCELCSSNVFLIWPTNIWSAVNQSLIRNRFKCDRAPYQKCVSQRFLILFVLYSCR